MTEKSVFSVTQVNEYLKMLLDGDRILSSIYVRGEISNFKRYSSGHCYFTVKDENAQLKAVMFRSHAARLSFAPMDGMRVLVHGRVSVYETSGQYQLYADELIPDGAGSLALQFEQLKRKLEGEGLFDLSRKKPLPPMPFRIGVITSPSGAAVHDIQNILARRFPPAQMILYPAMVQGSEAPGHLIAGLEFFQAVDLVDVIILGRGGGSAEDLWAFNDEMLARTVAACRIPVISAVGHESDFTICDFVADRRAPTPSAAAELAVPELREILETLSAMGARMGELTRAKIAEGKRTLAQLSARRPFAHPEQLFDSFRMKLTLAEDALTRTSEQMLYRKRQALAATAGKLEAMSPLAVLSRGYAAVTKNGKTVLSAHSVGAGDDLEIRFSDGALTATVSERRDD